MPITLQGINSTPNSDTLHALQLKSMPIVSPGAGVVTTTVQDAISMPFNYKIRKVSVMLTAINLVDGTEVFNLVVGGLKGATSQAYTNTSVAANDNSATYGYPTNTAVAGNAVFSGDVGFNATNAFSSTTGTGWIALATTTGGYGIFVPTNYDAVYPQGVPLSLRVSTTASTGTISNLSVTIAYVPVPLRVKPGLAAGQILVAPGLDY